jgi:CBS domain-containing protein
MRLRDIMSDGVVLIGADQPASVARTTMRQHRIRHLVVVTGAQVVGIVSQRDFGGPRVTPAGDPPVRQFMATDIVSASPDTTVRQAANLMRGRTIGCLPVFENGDVVGIVTTTDLLDQLGRGAVRPAVGIAPPPLRRPPSAGQVRGRKAMRGPTSPWLGHRSKRAPGERTAFPSALPRAAKRVRGRAVEAPPAHVRVIGATLDQSDRDLIARKLGMRLGKFAPSIERASVRLSDVNGPKGGLDHRCVIKVVLSGLPSVVVDRTDSVLARAVDGAIAAAGQAVRRGVQRRRLKPLRGRTTRSVILSS